MSASGAVGGLLALFMMLFYILLMLVVMATWSIFFIGIWAVVILNFVAMWKVFVKMGRQGWEAIIPYYNMYVLCEELFGDGIYFLIGFAPGVNMVFLLYTMYRLAQAFKKDTTFCVLMVIFQPVMIMLLAFGKTEAYEPGEKKLFRGM